MLPERLIQGDPFREISESVGIETDLIEKYRDAGFKAEADWMETEAHYRAEEARFTARGFRLVDGVMQQATALKVDHRPAFCAVDQFNTNCEAPFPAEFMDEYLQITAKRWFDRIAIASIVRDGIQEYVMVGMVGAARRYWLYRWSNSDEAVPFEQLLEVAEALSAADEHNMVAGRLQEQYEQDLERYRNYRWGTFDARWMRSGQMSAYWVVGTAVPTGLIAMFVGMWCIPFGIIFAIAVGMLLGYIDMRVYELAMGWSQDIASDRIVVKYPKTAKPVNPDVQLIDTAPILAAIER